jgi:hypothetical protein
LQQARPLLLLLLCADDPPSSTNQALPLLWQLLQPFSSA